MVTVDVPPEWALYGTSMAMEVLESHEGEWVPVDSDSRDNILGGFQHEDQGRL